MAKTFGEICRDTALAMIVIGGVAVVAETHRNSNPNNNDSQPKASSPSRSNLADTNPTEIAGVPKVTTKTNSVDTPNRRVQFGGLPTQANTNVEAASQLNNSDTYTIQPGDTLGRIAAKYNTTVSGLMGLNPQITDPNLIEAGEAIVVGSAVSNSGANQRVGQNSSIPIGLNINQNQGVPKVEAKPVRPKLIKAENCTQTEVVGNYTVIFPNGEVLKVVEQPADDSNWVSTTEDELTLFQAAVEHGTTGLLAHNYLEAGKMIAGLKPGDKLRICDNRREIDVKIGGFDAFQALSPLDPTGDFIDLDDNNPQTRKWTAGQAFGKFYSGEYQVTLQTCIENGGDGSWGRLFVYAPWAQMVWVFGLELPEISGNKKDKSKYKRERNSRRHRRTR